MLTNKQWLLTEQNPCFMVRSAFILLLNMLTDYRDLDQLLEREAACLLASERSGSDGHEVCPK